MRYVGGEEIEVGDTADLFEGGEYYREVTVGSVSGYGSQGQVWLDYCNGFLILDGNLTEERLIFIKRSDP